MKTASLLVLALPLGLAACGGGQLRSEDHRVNHPIRVEQAARVATIAVTRTGKLDADPERLRAFVADYARRGHGPIEVIGAPAEVSAAARLLAQAGVRTEDILPNTAERSASGVTLRFDSYAAVPPECGAFASDTDSLFANPYNRVNSEWGCASQRNLGLMISDPMDLVRRRGADAATGASRPAGRVDDYGKYERPPAPVTNLGSN